MMTRACRLCGCTDFDCRACTEATGEPCWWVAPDLCSRCELELEQEAIEGDFEPPPTPALVPLVACSSLKRSAPNYARDLYSSALFRAARAYAEQLAGVSDWWYILSARHGLVEPDQALEPYDEPLTAVNSREWARLVATTLDLTFRGRRRPTLVLLAGRRYREHLEPMLLELGFGVETPLEGMNIGLQVRWLRDQVARREAAA